MNNLITKEHIESLVTEFISGTNVFLVEITISSSNVIHVSIDEDSGVTIETCVALSRKIEENLNRDEEDFELTVASAGLSEPFKVFRQYQKNIGKLVSVLTSDGKKYIGTITKVTPDGIAILCEEMVKLGPKGKKKKVETEIELLFSNIKKTLIEIIFKK